MYVKEKLPCVDWEMIPAKLTFFLTDGCFGSILPFINVFYKSLGLSATQAGIISGTSLAVSSLFNPLWSTLADATGYRKLVFIILCIGTATTVFSMPWIEQAVEKVEWTTKCPSNITTNKTKLAGCHLSRRLLIPHTLFYTLLPLNVVAWIFFTSLRCYVDGTVTNVSNTREMKKNYGRQRAVACIGFALFNVITGIIIDHFHPHHMSPYTAVFYVFLPCVVCLTPVGCVLIGQAKWDQEEQSESRQKVWKQLLLLFKQLDIVIFFVFVFVYGLVLNVYNSFFFMLMEHQFNSTKTLMSCCLAIGLGFELLTYVFAPQVMQLLRGTTISIIVGIFSFLPRYVFMSYVQSPWLMLISQPLHGLGMGLTWAAIVDHTYSSVPKDIKVSAIVFVSSVVNVGTSAAVNMVGGVMYDRMGGRLLFFYSGILAGMLGLLMVIYFTFQHQADSRESKSKRKTYPDGRCNDIDAEQVSGV